VCRNCDARFSSSSYQEYAAAVGLRKEATFSELFATDETERIIRVAVNVDEAPEPTDAY
jgi:hypothetical protein